MNDEQDSRHNRGLRFLRWFCPPQLLEEIEGDLLQRFERDLKEGHSIASTQRRLFWSVLRYFRPGILLRNKYSLNFFAMHLFLNNLQLSFRVLRKDKLFSAINLFGLTVSMAAGLLIFQYVFFELNYDRSSIEAARTYRLYTSTYLRGSLSSQSALTASTLGPKLKAQLPEVAQIVRVSSTRFWFDCALSYSNGTTQKIFNQKNVYYADPGAFSIFSYRLVAGDPTTALTQPFSLVLSEQAAAKYFGTGEAIGKTLRLKGSFEDHDYLVTGVMTNPRPDSHLDAEVFASISTLERNPGFEYSDGYTYLQLAPQAPVSNVSTKLHQLATQLLPPSDERTTQLDVEPVTDIHLYSTLLDQIRPMGNITTLYLLLGVAIIVLIMAWINYINLTTARSFARAREIGVRKISGATRAQIAYKFLTEVVVFNTIGLVAAIATAYLCAPWFYSFLQVAVPQNYLIENRVGTNINLLLGVFATGIFISGIVPALSLSGFEPIRILRERWMAPVSGLSLRKVTVVFQFFCATALAIAVLTFNQQFQFLKNQDLGIDIRHTMILRAPVNVDSTYSRRLRNFKTELTQLAVVKNISTSSSVPGNQIGWTASVKKEKSGRIADNFTINVIDPDFISTYDLRLLAGRNFEERDFPGEHFGNKVEPVILNRAGLKYLQFENPEDAIGTTVYWGDNECVVVGILENFHQESLKKSIQPQLFTANTGPILSLKLTPPLDKDVSETIDQVHRAWDQHFPNNAFDFLFLENAYEEQYASDKQVARVFNFFCLLALTISCLGLFALSLFSVQLRTKEISIRKVLGASVTHLLQLLTREYLVLVIVSAAIAIPVSYWGVDYWLSGFATRLTPSIRIYLVPIATILAVALLTVGFQTMKVVLKNPVENLKHE